MEEEEREMTLRVKHTIADRVYYIKSRGRESIWDVHRKIAAAVEVEIGQINLLFCNGRLLELDTRVSSNKITEGTTIFFSWRLGKIAWFHHPSLESLQGIIDSPASSSALELPTERYALEERGNLTVVGMRGPLGTPFEGGVLLFVAELQGDVLKSLSLLTPFHHPYVFTPMGQALAEARAGLKKEAEKIAHLMVPQIQQNIGTSVPEWGTILWQASNPSFSDLRKQLDGLYNLFSRDLWGKVLVPSSSSAPLLPVWDRWLNDTENEKKTAQALAQIYLKGQSGNPEHYRHCTAEFKLEVRQWLLVCSRLHNTGWVYLPQELRELVIEQLFRLHHPIVTIDAEGRLRGVEETIREYTKYVKEFGGRDIIPEQIRQ